MYNDGLYLNTYLRHFIFLKDKIYDSFTSNTPSLKDNQAYGYKSLGLEQKRKILLNLSYLSFLYFRCHNFPCNIVDSSYQNVQFTSSSC